MSHWLPRFRVQWLVLQQPARSGSPALTARQVGPVPIPRHQKHEATSAMAPAAVIPSAPGEERAPFFGGSWLIRWHCLCSTRYRRPDSAWGGNVVSQITGAFALLLGSCSSRNRPVPQTSPAHLASELQRVPGWGGPNVFWGTLAVPCQGKGGEGRLSVLKNPSGAQGAARVSPQALLGCAPRLQRPSFRASRRKRGREQGCFTRGACCT